MNIPPQPPKPESIRRARLQDSIQLQSEIGFETGAQYQARIRRETALAQYLLQTEEMDAILMKRLKPEKLHELVEFAVTALAAVGVIGGCMSLFIGVISVVERQYGAVAAIAAAVTILNLPNIAFRVAKWFRP